MNRHYSKKKTSKKLNYEKSAYLLLIVFSVCLCNCNVSNPETEQLTDNDGTPVSQNDKQSENAINDIVLYRYCLDHDINTDSVNKLLSNNNFPLYLKHTKYGKDDVDILSYQNGTQEPIDFYVSNYYSPEYIYEISRLEYDSVSFYRIIITEDVVGLDYFLLVRTAPFTIYVSDLYNANAMSYDFIEESIDFEKNTIKILNEEKEFETVSFAQLKKYPILSLY